LFEILFDGLGVVRFFLKRFAFFMGRLGFI